MLETNEAIQVAIERNKAYVAEEVLASDISFTNLNGDIHFETIEEENDLKISLKKKEA